MAGFSFQKKRGVVTVVTIDGKDYEVDISPSNYGFVKKVTKLVKDFAEMSAALKGKGLEEMGGLESVLDAVVAKQREIVDLLFPGKWDEFFAASGEDISAMTELLVYVVEQIQKDAVTAQVASARPGIDGDGERV